MTAGGSLSTTTTRAWDACLMGPMLDRWYCCAFVLLMTNQKPDDEAYYRMT
jgi:hypothetical protein